MFCFGCFCIFWEIVTTRPLKAHGGRNSPRLLQGWGFDHSVRIIISILYTAAALYVSTTSRVSPTWYLKVGYLGRMDSFQQRWVCSNAIHYFMVTVIWRSSHPNENVQAKGMQDPCFASENLWLRFVENMREKTLLCLVWCHMVVLLAIHLLIFQLLNAVTPPKPLVNFWTCTVPLT